MKTERTVILPWLLSASLALAQTFVPRAGPDPALGQAEYDRFCPSQNGTIKTLSPSSSVVVHCDAIPRLPVLGDREWTASMEDCGLWCENMGTACMASFWDPRDGACYWSGAQAVEPKTKYVSLVQMTSLDSCDKEKEQCFKAKAQCLNDKAACLKDKKNCEAREKACLDEKKDCLKKRDEFEREKDRWHTSYNQCMGSKSSLDKQLSSVRGQLAICHAENNRLRNPPRTRTPRTVRILSQGYFQNGGYRPDDGNQLVVSWQSGNTRDVWAIYDDLGPLPFIYPAPGGQQKVRTISVYGRVYCPRAPQVSFSVT